jgi:hypothetical protein
MPDGGVRTTSKKGAIKTLKLVVSFRIMEFKCSHGEITKALGIQPTTTWSPGEKVRNTRLVHKENLPIRHRKSPNAEFARGSLRSRGEELFTPESGCYPLV